jgi:hypothetical protein
MSKFFNYTFTQVSLDFHPRIQKLKTHQADYHTLKILSYFSCFQYRIFHRTIMPKHFKTVISQLLFWVYFRDKLLHEHFFFENSCKFQN